MKYFGIFLTKFKSFSDAFDLKRNLVFSLSDMLSATSMLVTDIVDEMCWRQLYVLVFAVRVNIIFYFQHPINVANIGIL